MFLIKTNFSYTIHRMQRIYVILLLTFFCVVSVHSTTIVTPYACSVKDVIGCYTDWANDMRALPHTAQDTDEDPMTQELCAWMCDLFNYTMAAVEYQYQCFCGNDWNPDYTPTEVDMSECESERCDGDLTEWCGGDDRMLGTLCLL